MEQELIKPIIRVGNSAGVILPISWINGRAKIELIKKPIRIEEETLEILKPYLKKIKGIYLVGSYARKEENSDSDIDILVISEGVDKRIKRGKYEIILISEDKLRRTLEENIMPLLPMIKEAKSILNENLIREYARLKPNKKNTAWIVEVTKSARKICSKSINLSKEIKENISDRIAYSLILGLRSVYILDCLNRDAIPTKKGLLDLLKKITNTKEYHESYEAYLRSKRNLPDKQTVSTETAKKINNYILQQLP